MKTQFVEGGQSIARALHLLRLCAQGRDGRRLSDLARSAALAPSSARRLLLALIEGGMVAQDATTRRYSPGPVLRGLALGAMPLRSPLGPARDALRALAEETGDTVYLVGRAGLDTVVLERLSGDGPVRVTNAQVGDRFPLGIGPGGVALLAALPPAEADAVMDDVATELPAWRGFTVDALRLEVAAARRDGHALAPERVTAGVSGVAVALSPGHAIALGTLTARLGSDRLPAVLRALRRAASEVGRELARQAPAQLPKRSPPANKRGSTRTSG